MSEQERPEWLDQLKRVRLGPDDQLVVRYPGVLSMATIARIRNAFEEVFPGRRVLVLEQGMGLEIVGPDNESLLREALVLAWAMLEQGASRKQVIEMIANALGVNERPEELSET